MKLVKGAETQNELVPHPQVVVKNQGGYLSCRVPPRRKESQSHTKLRCPRKEVLNFCL